MDMKKEELVCCIPACEGTEIFRAEAEMTTSEAEAEILKVLHTECAATVKGSDVQKGRVLVHGEAIFRVLCQNEDGDVRLVTETVPFSETVELKNCDENMYAITKVKACRTETKQIAPRKVRVKADLQADVFVYETKKQTYVSEIEEEGVEDKRQTVSFLQPCGKYQRRFEIREQVEIANENPSVYEILSVNGKISSEGYKVVNHKVVVNAMLNAVILYVDDSMYRICTASLSIPFTEIFEIENAEDDWVYLQNMTIDNILFEVEADEKGQMRLVHLNCTADYTADMFRPVTCTVVTDCYGVNRKTEIHTEKMSILRNKGELNGQVGIKGQIEIGNNPKVGQVYYLHAEPKVENVTVSDGVCKVQGLAEICVHYITEDEQCKLAVLQKSIPFSENFACDTNRAEVVIVVKASGISYTLNGDYVIDIRGNILFEGVALEKDSITGVCDMVLCETEKEENMPSVTVCFAQDGEGLWEVAKRYSASVKAIMEENNVTENSNLSGKRLIVPKNRGV